MFTCYFKVLLAIMSKKYNVFQSEFLWQSLAGLTLIVNVYYALVVMPPSHSWLNQG
uniref:Uncharacterized protein n=1 Tax=Anguilla anguilla TaxID=7936 RepID=A0A0E9W9X6_ANGAN